MKKFMLIAAMMVAAMSVNAQDEYKNEIGVSYGVGSVSNYASILFEAFTFSASDQGGFWGPIALEYYHHVSPVISVGAIGSVAGCTWSKSDDSVFKNAKTTYISVMPSVKFSWLRKAHFGMYSKLAAGAIFINSSADKNGSKESDSAVRFMGQVSALGMEFGSQLRGFVELGFGEQGILLAGLRCKF